jgi:hypothetical protein
LSSVISAPLLLSQIIETPFKGLDTPAQLTDLACSIAGQAGYSLAVKLADADLSRNGQCVEPGNDIKRIRANGGLGHDGRSYARCDQVAARRANGGSRRYHAPD